MMRTPRQRGVALLTVMLIVAMVSIAIVGMTSRQQIDIRRTEGMFRHSQAIQYLQGVEAWMPHLLRADREDNEVDHLDEAWAEQSLVLPVEGGQLSGYLQDMQGRYNLNNLGQTEEAGKQANLRFRRLLRALELDEGLADAIQDWIDLDQEVTFPGGAEDDYYLGQDPGYRSANRNMVSVSELRLVRNIDKEVYDILSPHVSALPEITPININTASAPVLATIMEDMTLSDAEGFVETRDSDPYTSVDQFLSDKLFAGKEIQEDTLSVSTRYFALQATAEIGHITQQQGVLYMRDDKGEVITLMRSQGAL
jgi:general secretion pathway protein K